MKKTIFATLIALTSISLMACSKNNESSVKETKEPEVAKVKKHEATDLPVEILYKTGPDISNMGTIVTRTIESVSWEKVNQENKIKFNELYSSYVKNEITNLDDDYQMIKIVMSKKNSFKEGYKPTAYEKEHLEDQGVFALTKNTGLVIGNDNISKQYPTILSQLTSLMDSALMDFPDRNNNGILYIAVPIELYKANKNDMQLEIYPSKEDKLMNPIYLDIK